MYRVAVSTTFTARHRLTVPHAGPEGRLHEHRYHVELEVAGHKLDEHGYLVDVDALVEELDSFTTRYRESILNDQPAFEDRNPSIEYFARIAASFFDTNLDTDRLSALCVTVGEDDVARASYRLEY